MPSGQKCLFLTSVLLDLKIGVKGIFVCLGLGFLCFTEGQPYQFILLINREDLDNPNNIPTLD